MASTPDMAPTRGNGSTRAAARSTAAATTPARRRRSSARSRDEDLGAQIDQLQADLKAIAATITGMAEAKVQGVQRAAGREVKNLARTGQHAVEDVQDEFTQFERQIKDTIRDKPLTAVAGAVALGFLLAVVTRSN